MATVLMKGMSFGSPSVVTIASGVLTVPPGVSYVAAAAESSTSDQIDSITKSGAKRGDVLILEADSGDTITVDDANVDLGASTRVLTSTGQYLTLMYSGSGWSEVAYAAGDNT